MIIPNFFFISSSIFIWVLLISWIYILYKAYRLANEAELKVQNIKNTFKLTGLTLLSKILELTKGGEYDDKQKK